MEIHSRSADGWNRHAVARVGPAGGGSVRDRIRIRGDRNRCRPPTYTPRLRRTGAHHGPAFAALTRLAVDGDCPMRDFAARRATADRSFRIHPVCSTRPCRRLPRRWPRAIRDDSTEVTYLPVAIEAIRLFGDVGPRARCRAELTSLDDGGEGVLGRVTLTDVDGTPTAEITGVYLRRVERRTVPLPLNSRAFDTTWTPAPWLAGETPLPRAAGCCSPTTPTRTISRTVRRRLQLTHRRVITENMSDESAVLQAFAKTASEPELPPVGVAIFGESSICGADGDDPLGSSAR